MTDNTPEGLPPLADLSEALARGREPRRLWTVLHSVEDTTKSSLPQLMPVFGCGLIAGPYKLNRSVRSDGDVAFLHVL